MSYTSICVGETPHSINLGTIQRQQPNLKVGRSAANFRMVDGRKWSECSCVSSTNLICLYTSLIYTTIYQYIINFNCITFRTCGYDIISNQYLSPPARTFHCHSFLVVNFLVSVALHYRYLAPYPAQVVTTEFDYHYHYHYQRMYNPFQIL